MELAALPWLVFSLDYHGSRFSPTRCLNCFLGLFLRPAITYLGEQVAAKWVMCHSSASGLAALELLLASDSKRPAGGLS